MIIAQIKNNIVLDTIVVDDLSLLPLFVDDLITDLPYDNLVRIDTLDPRPGVGWSYNGTTFSPPPDSGD